MSRFDNSTPVRHDLHVCARCARPFVVPVSILDVHDDGRYVVELSCANCDARSLGTHDEASLEELDHDAFPTSARHGIRRPIGSSVRSWTSSG